MLRSAFLKSLLVLALLFTQQGAVTHAISHVLAEKSQDQSLPHDRHCELCGAYAQVGSALGSSQLSFDPSFFTDEHHVDAAAAFRNHPLAAFSARAPPRYA